MGITNDNNNNNNNNNNKSSKTSGRCSIYPSGSYVTGCMDLLAGKGKESLLLRIFYPSSLTNVHDHVEKWTNWYLGTQYSKGVSKFFTPLGVTNPFYQLLTDIYTKKSKIPSVWEAPVADGSFPLVIFSHGLAANRNVYSSICNDVASHGFIVAALEHRDRSASATFFLNKNGKKKWILLKTKVIPKGEFDLRYKQVKYRAKECSKALDILEQLDHGKLEANELSSRFDLHLFQGKINTSKAIISGHSFGGATAILCLAKDDRFKSGICLDPWMYPLDAFHQKQISYPETELNEMENLSENVKKPLLFILMERFQSQKNIQAMTKYINQKNRVWTLLKADHNDQTDTGMLFKDDWFMVKILAGCLSNERPETSLKLNNSLMLNFICETLGEEQPYNEDYADFVYRNSRFATEGALGSAKVMVGWNTKLINMGL
ncbi:UNVERIFIED_CONTAM: hypothetical protein RMT77_014031 [Armadillidium vulgare]